MKNDLFIVDTTLRDGEQSAGRAMTKEQKVFIAGLLDEAGVSQIEAGIPAMGKYEKDTIAEIIARRQTAVISVWNKLSISDIKSAIDCQPDLMHISVPVSYPQIYKKLHANKNWVIKNMQECVSYALDAGYPVTVGLEDASRADFSFVVMLCGLLMDMGVRRVRFADTVGILSPGRTATLVSDLINHTGIDVEMHAHNDLGMAVANSIAAAKAGAKYMDTTIFGIGERTGNCNFSKLIHIAALAFKTTPSYLQTLDIENRTAPVLC